MQRDKILHFLTGFAIAGHLLPLIGGILAVTAAILIGFTIEVYQRRMETGVFDIWDTIAVIIGSIEAAVYMSYINHIL